MMYTISPGIWTELAEYGVEVIHQAGHAITVEVIDGRIETTPDHVECQLRAPGGSYPKMWTAPIAGIYVFGVIDRRHEFRTSISLTASQLVLEDAAGFETDQGMVYAGPSIGMNSGAPLITEPSPIDAEWRSS